MNRLRRSLDAIDKIETEHPYATAIGAGALHFALGSVITHLGDKAGVSLRHGRSHSPKRQEFFEKHPTLSAIGLSTAVPLAEEYLWRKWLPNKIELKFPDQPNMQRAVKLGVVAAFAALHAGKDGIPVNQAIGGALYQHTYNKNGIKSSALAHATNNTLAVAQYAIKKTAMKW